MLRALTLAVLVAACAANAPPSASTFEGGSADPVEHFLQTCGELAPAAPGEINATTGWVERPRQLAPSDERTTYVQTRQWSKTDGDRPDTAWLSEWGTRSSEGNFLSYSCTVTFNGASFEEIDTRLRNAGYRYRRVVNIPGLDGAPRTQRSQWSGQSTLATYDHDVSRCEVTLDHGERDPVGAPCADCRQNVLICYVDSCNLPPSERRAWHARRGFQE